MKLYYLMAVEGRRPNTDTADMKMVCCCPMGELNCQDLSDSPNWMEELAGSVLQDRGGPSEEMKKLTALLLLYNAHSSLMYLEI